MSLLHDNESTQSKTANAKGESLGEIVKIQMVLSDDDTQHPVLMYSADLCCKTFIHLDSQNDNYYRRI